MPPIGWVPISGPGVTQVSRRRRRRPIPSERTDSSFEESVPLRTGASGAKLPPRLGSAKPVSVLTSPPCGTVSASPGFGLGRDPQKEGTRTGGDPPSRTHRRALRPYVRTSPPPQASMISTRDPVHPCPAPPTRPCYKVHKPSSQAAGSVRMPTLPCSAAWPACGRAFEPFSMPRPA